jgi:triosephosphate isomerase
MTKIIIANWKMNGSNSFIENFFDHWHRPKNNHIVVFCPPFPYLEKVRQFFPFIGGQDCHIEDHGAFTGDISAAMLADVGCQYVILGHSERRAYHQESNAIVLKKAKQALNHGLTPIICVGESLKERQSGRAHDVVLQQLRESLPLSDRIIIAYEPIWAIGTGLTATEEEIALIHQQIANAYPGLKILYGGSVNEKNSTDIMNISHVDGVLVGGASLKADLFGQICQY